MYLLMQLRQRLKATETIQKTTNAMRLIAMASHARLQETKKNLDIYKQELNRILDAVTEYQPPQECPPSSAKKVMVIVVGSQKGLCGNFNTSLVTYFQHHPPQAQEYDLLVIGKQMKETLFHQGIAPQLNYDHFTVHDVPAFVQSLTDFITTTNQGPPLYDKLIIYSTVPKTFFLHKHVITTFSSTACLPNNSATQQENNMKDLQPPFEEQSLRTTMLRLTFLSLKTRVHSLLIDSLLAEASSRFLSMDTATRNAEEVITTMKLNYNKLRQTGITRELTDLIGGLTRS
jgi:F-type H+-transporting ATPase subunit gamma